MTITKQQATETRKANARMHKADAALISSRMAEAAREIREASRAKEIKARIEEMMDAISVGAQYEDFQPEKAELEIELAGLEGSN